MISSEKESSSSFNEYIIINFYAFTGNSAKDNNILTKQVIHTYKDEFYKLGLHSLDNFLNFHGFSSLIGDRLINKFNNVITCIGYFYDDK